MQHITDAPPQPPPDTSMSPPVHPSAAPPTAQPADVVDPSHPSRVVLVSGVPHHAADAQVMLELEYWGPVRAFFLGARSRGCIMVQYFDLRHAQSALLSIRSQFSARMRPSSGSSSSQQPMQSCARPYKPVLANAGLVMDDAQKIMVPSSASSLSPPSRFSAFAVPFDPYHDGGGDERGLIGGAAAWADFVATVPLFFLNAADSSNQGMLVVFFLRADNVRALFQQYGSLRDVRQGTNRNNAFVEFFDVRDAARAKEALDGAEVQGRRIKVEFSQPERGARSTVAPTAFPAAPSYNYGASTGYHAFDVGHLAAAASAGFAPDPIYTPEYHYQRQQQQQQLCVYYSPQQQYYRQPPATNWRCSEGSSFNQDMYPLVSSQAKSCIITSSAEEQLTGTGGSDEEDLEFNPGENEDHGRTTLTILNIPIHYSLTVILRALDRHCNTYNDTLRSHEKISAYDFVYLPLDFMRKCNLGYAIVNFTTVEATKRLYEDFHDHRWEQLGSSKNCQVAYARVQGRAQCQDLFHSGEYLPQVFDPPMGLQSSPPKVYLAGRKNSRQHQAEQQRSDVQSAAESSSSARAGSSEGQQTSTDIEQLEADEEEDEVDVETLLEPQDGDRDQSSKEDVTVAVVSDCSSTKLPDCCSLLESHGVILTEELCSKLNALDHDNVAAAWSMDQTLSLPVKRIQFLRKLELLPADNDIGIILVISTSSTIDATLQVLRASFPSKLVGRMTQHEWMAASLDIVVALPEDKYTSIIGSYITCAILDVELEKNSQIHKAIQTLQYYGKVTVPFVASQWRPSQSPHKWLDPPTLASIGTKFKEKLLQVLPEVALCPGLGDEYFTKIASFSRSDLVLDWSGLLAFMPSLLRGLRVEGATSLVVVSDDKLDSVRKLLHLLAEDMRLSSLLATRILISTPQIIASALEERRRKVTEVVLVDMISLESTISALPQIESMIRLTGPAIIRAHSSTNSPQAERLLKTFCDKLVKWPSAAITLEKVHLFQATTETETGKVDTLINVWKKTGRRLSKLKLSVFCSDPGRVKWLASLLKLWEVPVCIRHSAMTQGELDRSKEDYHRGPDALVLTDILTDQGGWTDIVVFDLPESQEEYRCQFGAARWRLGKIVINLVAGKSEARKLSMLCQGFNVKPLPPNLEKLYLLHGR